MQNIAWGTSLKRYIDNFKNQFSLISFYFPVKLKIKIIKESTDNHALEAAVPR